MFGELDLQEIVRRLVKYFIEGFVVAAVAYGIPKKGLALEEVVVIALVATMTFSILDVFVPAIGASARTGAGFGIGANLVGFPAIPK
jgi:hypothetical protein